MPLLTLASNSVGGDRGEDDSHEYDEAGAMREFTSTYLPLNMFYKQIEMRFVSKPIFRTRCLRYTRPINVAGSSRQRRRDLHICDMMPFRMLGLEAGIDDAYSRAVKTLCFKVNSLSLCSDHNRRGQIAGVCAQLKNNNATIETVEMEYDEKGFDICFSNTNFIDWQRNTDGWSISVMLAPRKGAKRFGRKWTSHVEMHTLSTDFTRSLPDGVFTVSLLEEPKDDEDKIKVGWLFGNLEWKYSLSDEPAEFEEPPATVNSKETLTYFYLFGEGSRHYSEEASDFRCPWCGITCNAFIGLLCHLESSHSKFRFWHDRTLSKNSVRNYLFVTQTARPAATNTSSYYLDVVLDDHIQTFAIHNGSTAALSLARFFWIMYRAPTALKRHLGLVSQPRSVAKSSFVRQRARDRRASDVGFRNSTSRTAVESRSVRSCSPKRRKASATSRQKIPKIKEDKFHHGATMVPMIQEDVDFNSDDNVDDCWRNSQQRETLENMEDVTWSEKRMMAMWNNFIREHRVQSDAHCAQLCLEFANEHRVEIIRQNLRYALLSHLMNLWEFGVLDSSMVGSCIRTLEDSESIEPPAAANVGHSSA